MNVLPLPPSGKIAEPGVYDLPISVYHSQCCDGPSISSSGLRTIFSRSPAHYWIESDLNPDRLEREEKPHFSVGRAAHHLLLGEEDFARHFAVQPEMAPDGRAWNGNNLSCKAWKAERALEGKTVLTPADVETIRGLAGLQPWQKGMTNCGLANTPIVMDGALAGEIERSLIWREGATWLKSRPDVIPNASGDFVDLKTTTSVEDRDLGRTIYDFGYHVQGALVGMAAKAVLGIDMTSFTLVFVDKTPPHPVAVKTLSEADLVLGEQQVFAALRIFERCLETNTWPGPTARQADAQYLNLPPWGREEIERRLQMAEQDLAA